MNEFFIQIDKIITSIVENPYFGLIGFVIGVASLIFSFYIAKRDKRIKNLKCILVSNNLITKSESLFPKLLIKYDGKELVNFTITKIRIKNTGSEVLRMNDIAQSDPITFSTKTQNNAFLLDYGIIYESNKLNNFSIEKINDNSIKLSFDYIEPKDTTVIQLLHTGRDNTDIEVKGTVIGAKEPFLSVDGDIMLPKDPIFQKILSLSPRTLTIGTLFVFILIFSVTSYLFYWITTKILVGIICFLPVIPLLWSLIAIMIRKPDKDKEIITNDILLYAFRRAMERVDHDKS